MWNNTNGSWVLAGSAEWRRAAEVSDGEIPYTLDWSHPLTHTHTHTEAVTIWLHCVTKWYYAVNLHKHNRAARFCVCVRACVHNQRKLCNSQSSQSCNTHAHAYTYTHFFSNGGGQWQLQRVFFSQETGEGWEVGEGSQVSLKRLANREWENSQRKSWVVSVIYHSFSSLF